MSPFMCPCQLTYTELKDTREGGGHTLVHFSWSTQLSKKAMFVLFTWIFALKLLPNCSLSPLFSQHSHIVISSFDDETWTSQVPLITISTCCGEMPIVWEKDKNKVKTGSLPGAISDWLTCTGERKKGCENLAKKKEHKGKSRLRLLLYLMYPCISCQLAPVEALMN